jgi:hypothetical protein
MNVCTLHFEESVTRRMAKHKCGKNEAQQGGGLNALTRVSHL